MNNLFIILSFIFLGFIIITALSIGSIYYAAIKNEDIGSEEIIEKYVSKCFKIFILIMLFLIYLFRKEGY